jgi:hypothetical protein
MPKTSGSLTYGFTEADVGLQAFLRDGRNDPAEMRRRLEERFHRAFDGRALEYARRKVGGATSMRVRNGRRPGASTLMADGSATRPDCAPSNHHAEPDWLEEGACECTVRSHFACSYGMPQDAVAFGTSRGHRSCGVSPHGAYRYTALVKELQIRLTQAQAEAARLEGTPATCLRACVRPSVSLRL